MSSPLVETFKALRPAGGFRCILADPPWEYQARSPLGLGKSAQQHYECQDLEWICSLPVEALAADDCALFLWVTWPLMPVWVKVIRAWGFEFAGLAWEWIKFNEQTGKYAFGGGYGTRKNLEPTLLCTRGNPSLRQSSEFFGQTQSADAHSVRDFMFHWPLDAIREARREHSRKPDQAYGRIEQMFEGPYLEMFARTKRPGWVSWGQETGKFEP